jgi:iron complex transport system substrate-binding protein
MKRLIAAIALAGLTLAACGGDDGATEDSTAATTAAPQTTAPATTDTTVIEPTATEPASTNPEVTTPTPEATEPVTIEHLYGETVIEGLPERIVSLDMQWTDVLTALGHPPVAAVTDPTMGGWYPWQQTDGVEPITIGADYEIPFETVATFQPDLIVGSWGIADQQAYDALTAIAPTIPLLDERDVDPWEDMAAVAGEFLDEAQAAQTLVDDADQAAADLAAELPGLEGTTYALANYIPGDQIYVVADPDDGASQVFAKLGMQIDPELLAKDSGGVGRVELSLENIGELDSDVLLILTNGADTSDIPGFDALPAVQSGAFSVLDYAPVVGLNTPTPLSIPYSLDYIRAALEAAAAT